MHALATLRRDVQAAKDRDPAARTSIEVLLTYAGVHAVWGHRLAHALWGRGLHLPARIWAAFVRLLTGVEIHPGASIGPGFFIDHAAGVVIGETAEVGTDVTIYHGVTLGGTSLGRTKRHPTVGDRVTIGAGAKILGPVRIGEGSRIGANAVVVKDVPPNSVVVGVPGQVLVRSKPRPAMAPLDLQDTVVPDLVGVTLQGLLHRVDDIETSLHGAPTNGRARPSEAGVWSGDDFSI